jgi:hypothetical protein
MTVKTRTIIIKQKLWSTKIFENATFNIDNWMIEVYQRIDWKIKINFFIQKNIISLTY